MAEPDAPTPGDRLRQWLAASGRHATFIETHVSVVALTADRAYKVKKAVRFPFLDLSTRERRLAMCWREVHLNRRLAPDVYLGVIDITGAAGEPVEHAIEMIRLPDAIRLDHLLTDADTPARLTQLAHHLVEFHATADGSDAIDQSGTAAAVRRLWRDEIAGLTPFAGTVVPRRDAQACARLARNYIDGRAALFTDRVRRGRIRDGHGDLRCDDVFILPDGIRIIDCLEFDDRRRRGDVLTDVAFLAMDLQWRGREDLAEWFLSEYSRLSGDHWPQSLAHHWIAYFAHVRAKVACLNGAVGGAAARRDAEEHIALARTHLRLAQVHLVVAGGLPGTGKSTVTRELARRGEFDVLRSDVVRRELPALVAADPGVRYSAAGRAAVYRSMLHRAGKAMGLGRSVILDASWAARDDRRDAANLAAACGAELVQLCCVAPTSVTQQRIRDRLSAGTDESEADVAVARSMAARFDAWPEASVIATTGDIAESVAAAAAALTDTLIR